MGASVTELFPSVVLERQGKIGSHPVVEDDRKLLVDIANWANARLQITSATSKPLLPEVRERAQKALLALTQERPKQ